MEKFKFNQEESFLLSDSEYSIDTDIAIRRRTICRTDDHNMCDSSQNGLQNRRS